VAKDYREIIIEKKDRKCYNLHLSELGIRIGDVDPPLEQIGDEMDVLVPRTVLPLPLETEILVGVDFAIVLDTDALDVVVQLLHGVGIGFIEDVASIAS